MLLKEIFISSILFGLGVFFLLAGSNKTSVGKKIINEIVEYKLRSTYYKGYSRNDMEKNIKLIWKIGGYIFVISSLIEIIL